MERKIFLYSFQIFMHRSVTIIFKNHYMLIVKYLTLRHKNIRILKFY